jgi:hypothetical protein
MGKGGGEGKGGEMTQTLYKKKKSCGYMSSSVSSYGMI